MLFVILALIFQTAVFTGGFARIAHGTAVKHNAVAELRRTFRGENPAELLLDLWRFFEIVYQTEAVGNADAVRVYNHRARNMKHVAKNKIRGFSAYSGKSGELFHCGRHFAAMLFKQNL